jgi:hypothetical protein
MNSTSRNFWILVGGMTIMVFSSVVYRAGVDAARKPARAARINDFSLSVPKHPGRSEEPLKADKRVVELSPVVITKSEAMPSKPAAKPAAKKNCYDHQLTQSHLHSKNESTILDNAGKVRICN